jgi:hypothetical protein
LNWEKFFEPPKTPKGGKNSLKIPSPLPKMVNQIGAKNLLKIRHFLVNQGTKLRSKNPYSFIITFLIAPDVIDF